MERVIRTAVTRSLQEKRCLRVVVARTGEWRVTPDKFERGDRVIAEAFGREVLRVKR